LRTPEGQTYGPVDRPTLDQWMSEGRISPTCQIREGTAAWMPAGQVYANLGSPPLTYGDNPFRADPSENPYASTALAGTARSFREPHRGILILVLGILGFVIGCPLFGIFAWVMGNNDLQKMRAGLMDPEGKGLTQAGKILGIVHLCLWGLMIVFFMILVVAGRGF
jgi:hypothetical protein